MYSEKEISLVDFHKVALESARNAGYQYIACIVSRYAEFDKGFDYLEKHWASFHDLSGREILILVAGDEVRGKLKSDRMKAFVDNEGANLINRNIVISGELNIIGRKKKPFDSRLREGDVEGMLSKARHTNQTSDLMDYFEIDENDIPAICLTSTITGVTTTLKLSDSVGDEFYKAIKYLQAKLKNNLHNLVRLSEEVDSINKMLAKRDQLNNSFTAWMKNNSMSDVELIDFVNCFQQLEFGEHPKISKEDARKKFKGYVKLPKRYKYGRKKLDRYYSLVDYEANLIIGTHLCEKSLKQELQAKLNMIYEHERNVVAGLCRHLEIENIKDITNSFDRKINLGVTKIDIKILVKRLVRIGSHIKRAYRKF